ncbi:unnamed protein product [Lampetra fluviatilis]
MGPAARHLSRLSRLPGNSSSSSHAFAAVESSSESGRRRRYRQEYNTHVVLCQTLNKLKDCCIKMHHQP